MAKISSAKIDGIDVIFEAIDLSAKDLSPSADNTIDEPFFTASDIYQTAGLSYRQLNNWDLKGVLPNSRRKEAGWRTFSFREVFAIFVCSEIRTRFSVPLESLKSLQIHLMQDDIDFLGKALEKVSEDAFALYLLTDLKESFSMISDVELQSPSISGLLKGDAPAAFILLKLNPLLNKITRLLENPFQLQTSSVAYKAIDQKRNGKTIRTEQEGEVLRLVREGTFDRITVQLKDGKIIGAETEKDVPKSQQKHLLEILSSREYQTVTITQHDGETIRIRQKVPIKLLQTTGSEPLHRQKNPEGRGKA